jgi:hypothetical protein
MKEFAVAFVKAQAKVKSAVKDSPNPAFKQDGKPSKYADLSSVWDACRAALAENGFGVLQPTNFDDKDFWLETTLLHESGEERTGRYPIRAASQTPQAIGSAITYARRYALAAMLGIVTDADDDGNAASKQVNGHDEAPARQQAPTPQSRKNEAKGVGDAREWINTAIAVLPKKKTIPDLDRWVEVNGPTMEKVKDIVPDDYAALATRIDEAYARMNTLAAG